MGPVRRLQRPVKPRAAESDNQDSLASAGSESDDGVLHRSRETSSQEDESHEVDPDSDPEDGATLKDISFGALVKAQETFLPKSRKRKVADEFEDTKDSINDTSVEPNVERQFTPKHLREKPASRSSKHAPTIQSSRHAVSRKREIFDPSPALKFRDPRFDPTVTASNHDGNAAEKANKNYSFLSSYQATEILDLKTEIKKTKDPEAAAQLKRQVMSIESKVRNSEARQREQQILRKHRQAEKEAIRSGQKSKPYYLKESEVKKLANAERLEGMGKRAREKTLERKRKREKGKEARHMPRVRREA